MNYKLLAADMDGTLLNDDSALTQRTITALQAAMDKGVLFVPSTGRPLCAMEQINTAFSDDLPMILYNGAKVMTGKSNWVLFSQNLDFRCAQEAFAEGVRRGIPVTAWAGERLFASDDYESVQSYRAISGMDLTVVADMEPLRELGVTKVLWIVPNAVRYQDEMNAYFGGAVNCHASRPYYLEFVDARASKGLALEAVGRHYGIGPSEMIALGDGYNDVSMLEYAGLGIAMGNAPEDIKAICQGVTLSNNEDGVAEAIERYVLS